MLPATSGAAPARSVAHDIKVFHDVLGQRSRPLPAQIALIVGGKPEGRLIAGLKGQGKQFLIVDVKGGETVLTRHTGPRARISLDVAPTCRDNPQARYYLRATAVIRGEVRRAFSQGDCRWVVRVLAEGRRATVRTTFIFEN